MGEKYGTYWVSFVEGWCFVSVTPAWDVSTNGGGAESSAFWDALRRLRQRRNPRRPAKIAATGTATPTPIATAWDFGLLVAEGDAEVDVGPGTGVVVRLGTEELPEDEVVVALGGSTPAIAGILAASASIS
jgi:hypothetical protein